MNMNNEKFSSVIDELCAANNFLEMCRGYAQSDIPNMVALAETLYILQNKYEGIYEELCCINEHATKKVEVDG